MVISDSDKAFLEEFEKELEEANTEPVSDGQELEEGADNDLQDQEEEQHQTVSEEEEVTEPVDEGEEESVFTGSEQEEEGDELATSPSENQEQIDYESFYGQVMKPFKANGKIVEIRKPEEVISLMQMGANYTRKMQEISEHRKTIATLAEHGVNTEEDLLFLLDLKNKNPDPSVEHLP